METNPVLFLVKLYRPYILINISVIKRAIESLFDVDANLIAMLYTHYFKTLILMRGYELLWY